MEGFYSAEADILLMANTFRAVYQDGRLTTCRKCFFLCCVEKWARGRSRKMLKRSLPRSFSSK